jgi:amphi-Trp domain-containing protein
MQQSEKVQAAKRSKAERNRPSPEASQNGELPEKSRMRFRGTMHRDEAVSYFEAILAGLKHGSLQFRQGDSRLNLNLPLFVDVTVKASSKKTKGKVEFELQWDADINSNLTITSG